MTTRLWCVVTTDDKKIYVNAASLDWSSGFLSIHGANGFVQWLFAPGQWRYVFVCDETGKPLVIADVKVPP